MLDVYGPLLSKVLFPAYEAARGRPTVPLVEYLERTERWTLDELRDLQLGFLRRLIRHAYHHTQHYRSVLDAIDMVPEDFQSLDDLARLPLLDRDTVRSTIDTRTASAPPRWVVKKSTSGTTGQPVVVKYNAESRHWRDATRMRGYGWAGYRIGKRTLHYWGFPPKPESWFNRQKIALDRFMKRDFYVDCTPRSDEALHAAVRALVKFDPQVMVAYSAGAAALARFIVEHKLRTWKHDIPVLVGAERLWPHDREVIGEAFGPAFETYGCREVMLIGSECEQHDGLHTSMETMIVEVLVEDDGVVRPARAGETGQVAITDLHNLACPMIRYITGDLAVAHEERRCGCGRSLAKIGPIEGRVTETLRDGRGNAVNGLVFNILFGVMDHVARKFQVVQKLDGSVTMKVVPNGTPRLPEKASHALHDFAAKYLPGARFNIEYVEDIPLSAAGKRKVVVVEKPAA